MIKGHSINIRKIIIFAILICTFVMVVEVYAAQFEGPSFKVAENPANASKKETGQTASTQQNTKLDKSESITLTDLNVQITSDVYTEKDRHVLYCPKGNYMVVRNRIFLAGSDLDKVKRVEYILHPSFSNSNAISEDPTNDFEVWIWTWGGFLIKATVTTKNGQIFEKYYDFSFKSKFEDAQRKGIPQEMRCTE